MSAVTKRKWVRKEVLENFRLPDHHQTIVRILRNAGNNLHEVETAEGKTFHASLPKKFRKTCYIKRGDFVLTEPIVEGKKVKGEIVRILYGEHIKVIHEAGLWPPVFASQVLKKFGVGRQRYKGYYNEEIQSSDDDEVPGNPNESLVNYATYDSDSSEDYIPSNPNRPDVCDESDDDSSDDDSDLQPDSQDILNETDNEKLLEATR